MPLPLAPLTIRMPERMPPTGSWVPAPSHRAVLQGLVHGMTRDEYAAESGLARSTVAGYIHACLTRCSVICIRALAGQAIRLGIATVAPLPAPDLPDALTAVWAYLAADVRDDTLTAHIARATGYTRTMVDAALAELRSLGEPDSTLVVRGCAYGIITPEEPRTLPVLPRQHAGKRPLPSPRQHPVPPRADPLGLLPETMSRSTEPSVLSGPWVTGFAFDVVRVSPEVCRTALATLQEWHRPGPVVGSIEARTAFFLVEPGTLPDRWRTAGARLWKRGMSVQLPTSSGTCTAYWAVPYTGTYWNTHSIVQILGGSFTTPRG
ncbi:hypothetical protein [Streptomyces sp. NPDC092952]|uniref:hypothetical protein n=1 Tax=Streptomyces sp. NPDC092952 TaxID=3366018 RepID=UPI003801F7EA